MDRRRSLTLLAGATAVSAGLILLPDALGVVGPVADVAPARSYVGMNPQFRIFDSDIAPNSCVDGTGTPIKVSDLTGPQGQDIPADITSIVLNITADPANATDSRGFLTVHPKGTVRPPTSNLNWTKPKAGGVAGADSRDTIVANEATVEIGSDNSIVISGDAGCPRVVVDVIGYFRGSDFDPNESTSTTAAPTTTGGGFRVTIPG